MVDRSDLRGFLDVRKTFIKTKVTGTVPDFGGIPAPANQSIDLLLPHPGRVVTLVECQASSRIGITGGQTFD